MLSKNPKLNVLWALLLAFVIGAGIVACNQEEQAVAPEGDDLLQTLQAIADGPVDPSFRFNSSMINDGYTKRVIADFNSAMRTKGTELGQQAETNAFGDRAHQLLRMYKLSDSALWSTLYEEGFIDKQDRDILSILFAERDPAKLYAMREQVLADDALAQVKKERYVNALTVQLLVNKESIINGYIKTVQQFSSYTECISAAFAFYDTYYALLPEGWLDSALWECEQMFPL